MKFTRVAFVSVFLSIKLKQVLDWLPFFKSDSYTPFLIVGHPRTGTSLLHTYLNSHAHIHSLNEPLTNSSNVKALFKPYSRALHAVGFKYFFEYTADDLKRNSLLDILKSRPIKVILIRRKNQLRTFASLCIAEKTNEWSSTGSSKNTLLDKQITLTKESCIQAFQTYQKNELNTIAILKQAEIPLYEISYENLTDSPEDTMRGVQQFLGVKHQVLESLLLRQNTEKLSALILNYKNLKVEFLNTEFEHFFDE